MPPTLPDLAPQPVLRVAISALGCKVSAADAHQLEQLLDAAHPALELVPFPEPADVYILFTCTVTHVADRTTRKLVSRLRRAQPSARVVLTGCMAEAAPTAAEEVDGVWAVVSHRRLHELPGLLLAELARGPARIAPADRVAGPRPPMAVGHLHPLRRGLDRPFLKVQDGCATCCSYCILPRARGRPRSLPLPEVLRQLEVLTASGAAEVVLTGINLGAWGRDLDPPTTLVTLLEALAHQNRLPRLRLSSLEPEAVTRELLTLLAEIPCFCNHLHIPLQSGDNQVLSRMNRPYSAEQYEAAIRLAATYLPGLGLGTDVIVGFPGEQRTAHDQTVALLARLPFTYLHVFSYSPRAGTRAAHWDDDVPPPEKKRRSQELQQLDTRLRAMACAARLGHQLEVLVERRPDPATGLPCGYSRDYLEVLVLKDESQEAAVDLPGRLIRVRALETREGRLVGQQLPAPTGRC